MRRLFTHLQADGCLAVVFIVVALLAYAETFSFRPVAAEWPRAVLVLLVALSAMVILRRLIFPERDE